ncbi:MAG: hypothetical protein ACJ8R9_17660 [Steroidobacteraceae bacterium]
MTCAYAVNADENGRLQQAAAGYEAALLADPADLQTTVNLAVLYWQAAGHGSGAPDCTPVEFRWHAGRRLPELLESASRRFAGHAEIIFWKKYIAAAGAGAGLAACECRQLMQARPDYLEPAFVVFAETAGIEAEPEAMRLLADYSEQPTTRARYVTSIINAALSRHRWRSPCAATV